MLLLPRVQRGPRPATSAPLTSCRTGAHSRLSGSRWRAHHQGPCTAAALDLHSQTHNTQPCRKGICMQTVSWMVVPRGWWCQNEYASWVWRQQGTWAQRNASTRSLDNQLNTTGMTACVDVCAFHKTEVAAPTSKTLAHSSPAPTSGCMARSTPPVPACHCRMTPPWSAVST